MQKTAIVIPCYNEEKRLHLDAFRQTIREHQNIHFLFVNDGSKDGTASLLQGFCQENPEQLYFLDLPKNGGKAEAVRQGMCHVLAKGYDFVGFWDADLATPLYYIVKFSEILATSEHNIVMGSRVKLLGRRIERKPVRHYLGRIFATCASFLLRLPVYDTQCGAKMFRNLPSIRRAFATPFGVDWIFDVELLGRLLLLERTQQGPSVEKTTVEYPLDEWTDVPGSKVRAIHFVRALFEFLKVARMMFSKRLPPELPPPPP